MQPPKGHAAPRQGSRRPAEAQRQPRKCLKQRAWEEGDLVSPLPETGPPQRPSLHSNMLTHGLRSGPQPHRRAGSSRRLVQWGFGGAYVAARERKPVQGSTPRLPLGKHEAMRPPPTVAKVAVCTGRLPVAVREQQPKLLLLLDRARCRG